ncbi:MAG: RnfABCDGE type electron transport complex subunit C [[Clostridium] cellulosi]|nr:MAG: RnfABCDGE type electron transport complex subunit C [[Clostridium] cellulosi]
MMLKRPRGGLWLELNKTTAAERPIAELKAPARVYLPLKQCKGETPSLLVGRGSRVLKGQPIADGSHGLSCSLHSPVSGTVESIVEYNHPVGGKSMMAVISNDGRDMPYKAVQSRTDSAEGIIARVKSAGIVSSNDFSKPYWEKLRRFRERKVNTVIINAVEVEPYICSSQKIMDELPDVTVAGLELIMKCVGAKKAVLAVSDDIPEEVSRGMAEAAHLIDIELTIAHIPPKYPNGDEQFLMRALFAHEIEAQMKKGGKRPEVCFVYPQDCVNVQRAVNDGVPQITRIITVAGDAVTNPQNIEVPIGTKISDILNYCGLSFDPDRVVLGSPMRGVAIQSLDVPITKSVGAVLALKAAQRRNTKSICINCGKCVSVCPQGLLPNYIAMRAVKADFEALKGLNIDECIECGSCAYICPGRMPIVELIKNIKKAAI